MSRSLFLPIIAVISAIAIVTAMDAFGLFVYSALSLFPLMFFFWYLERNPRRDIGFVWGRLSHYGLAVLYPLLVLAAITIIAFAFGATDLSATDWSKSGLNILLVTASSILVAIITEEGFFRGWLWASFRKAGLGKHAVLLWTSLAFSLWHLSAVLLDTGFNPPLEQVPVFMINAFLLGAIWGLLRSISGSIVVSSVSHALWNGLVYVLFGFGKKAGAFGIQNTSFYGPEIGILGLVFNLLFVLLLWRWSITRERKTT